jgi:hypothetical protein
MPTITMVFLRNAVPVVLLAFVAGKLRFETESFLKFGVRMPLC